jgi:hypothetical protein
MWAGHGQNEQEQRFRCSGLVVRGGVEPPTFRFSGGLASPAESTTGRLSRPYDVRAVLGVQNQRHVSTAVVSTALASSAAVGTGAGGRQQISAPTNGSRFTVLRRKRCDLHEHLCEPRFRHALGMIFARGRI